MPDLIRDKLGSRTQPSTAGMWQVILRSLSSIIGAGIFVGIGIAAGAAGFYLIYALIVGAIVAFCTGLNTIQLAAYQQNSRDCNNSYNNNLPKSGDAEIYGYTDGLLNSWLGFTAALGLVLAQSSAAATAALGASGYLLSGLGLNPLWLVPIAILTIGSTVLMQLRGRPSKALKRLMPLIGAVTLVSFAVIGLTQAVSGNLARSDGAILSISGSIAGLPPVASMSGLLQATALITVAYGGYERIATLTHTHSLKRKSLAMGILISLTLLLYGCVAIVAMSLVGATVLNDAVEAFAAPLEVAARQFILFPGISLMVAIGAAVALVGMVNRLLAGLCRSLWRMGQRQDLPKTLAQLNVAKTLPTSAILIAGATTACFTLISVHAIWSFCAFAFLMYSAIANLAALHLPPASRLYPRGLAWVGLGWCLFLIPWLDRDIWLMGVGLIVVGLSWRGINLWVAEQAER